MILRYLIYQNSSCIRNFIQQHENFYRIMSAFLFILDLKTKLYSNILVWPSSEGYGLTIMWQEFNPSTTRSCFTTLNLLQLSTYYLWTLQIETVSITADRARIYPSIHETCHLDNFTYLFHLRTCRNLSMFLVFFKRELKIELIKPNSILKSA